MLEAWKRRHQGKLKRPLTKWEERASQGVGTGGAKALRQNSFGNHTQPQQDQRKRVQDTRRSQREHSHRLKGLGAGLRRSPGHWRAGVRKRAQLTSDLPRLWPPVCQLGAMLWAQHAQPCGCSVHQRGGHSVRRGRGAGGEWLPHVTGKEEVCHRYALTLPLRIPRAKTRLGSKSHSLLLLGCRGRGDIWGVWKR